MQLEEEIKKPIIVVGLKSDLAEQRSVDFQDGERTAEAYGAPYFECSAKQEINIEAVFDLLLTQIFK
jgi:GTPase SAR1 family protein